MTSTYFRYVYAYEWSYITVEVASFRFHWKEVMTITPFALWRACKKNNNFINIPLNFLLNPDRINILGRYGLMSVIKLFHHHWKNPCPLYIYISSFLFHISFPTKSGSNQFQLLLPFYFIFIFHLYKTIFY